MIIIDWGAAMFRVTGGSGSDCTGVTRRSFVQGGVLVLGGLTLADYLQARENQPSRDSAVILFWLSGGPGHMETWDPKPEAATEYRGPLGAIRTALPGVQVGELLPEQARLMRHLALVRSVRHGSGDHTKSNHWMLTGFEGPAFNAPDFMKQRRPALMLATAEHLMSACGFNILYGYTQSDEISLLFAPNENGFGRKLRKLISVLSAEASAKFSLLLGAVAVFDCRISELPSVDLVVDYFRWRNEDAHRNALSAHSYWLLRKQGKTVAEATAAMHGLSVAQKNELLFQNGINFNDLPLWQKRGSGLYWEEYARSAENPATGENVVAQRRRVRRDLELPMKDDYSAFLRKLLNEFGRTRA